MYEQHVPESRGAIRPSRVRVATIHNAPRANLAATFPMAPRIRAQVMTQKSPPNRCLFVTAYLSAHSTTNCRSRDVYVSQTHTRTHLRAFDIWLAVRSTARACVSDAEKTCAGVDCGPGATCASNRVSHPVVASHARIGDRFRSLSRAHLPSRLTRFILPR